jgi:signal transduction histidine kinase/DNA-binding response OmpR family regulator
VTRASSAAEDLFLTTEPLQALLREADWAATPLGPVERWPDSMRAAIKTVLLSRVPMMLWWGPQLIQLYNAAAVPVIGRKHPAAIGQGAAECYAEAWSELEPLTNLVMTGKGATFSHDLFLPYQRHGYVEETYWTLSCSPIHQGDRVNGLLVACMDTTRQVLSERRLGLLQGLGEVSSAEADSAQQAIRMAIAVIERNRTDVPFAMAYLLDDSRRFLHLVESFGVDPDTVLDWSAIPGPDDGIPGWRVVTNGAAEVVTGINAAFRAVFEPSVLGAVRPDDAVILPLRDRSSGTVAGTLALGVNPYRELDDEYRAFCLSVAGAVSTVLTDAMAYESQRRRAENLAALDAAKTRFLQNVSHELRTPLTLILGSLQAIRLEGRAYREDVDIAERGALRLRLLVDSLLAFAEADADELHAVLEPTDLALVTADVVSMFRAAIERAGMRLEVNAPTLPRPVEVDPEMWVRIVANLLSNALKFTSAGSIRVSLDQIVEDAVLVVQDTGVGIPPEELARVFERYYQVPGMIWRSRESIGIGLSLVSDLVRAHSGTIVVASTIGVGTTFTVRIPMGTASATPRPVEIPSGTAQAFRAEVDARVGAAGEQPDASWEPVRPEAGRLLLVEDNADMRAYLTRLLRSDGWSVTAVADVAAALRLPPPPPDLVLSDVMLPDTDGLELVRTLRRLPATARLPIVLLTARAGWESVAEGLGAGADDYVVKPFDRGELLARLRVHFELARLREYAVSQAEDEAANLRVALSSNRLIGAALGILMNRLEIGSDESFALLRETSQRLNRKLRDIADEVVLTGELPT